jgi:hypothetical protein
MNADDAGWYRRVIEQVAETIRLYVEETQPDAAGRLALCRDYLWWLPEELAFTGHDPESILAQLGTL